jgi:hypothetical protein
MRREVINALSSKKGTLIPAVQFQAVTFFDKNQDRQVIVLYSLGQDGIVREYVGQKWHPYPIQRE